MGLQLKLGNIVQSNDCKTLTITDGTGANDTEYYNYLPGTTDRYIHNINTPTE